MCWCPEDVWYTLQLTTTAVQCTTQLARHLQSLLSTLCVIAPLDHDHQGPGKRGGRRALKPPAVPNPNAAASPLERAGDHKAAALLSLETALNSSTPSRYTLKTVRSAVGNISKKQICLQEVGNLSRQKKGPLRFKGIPFSSERIHLI
jgi:hypothetical protein